MRALRSHLGLLLLAVSAAGCWDRTTRTERLTVDRTSPVLGDPARPVLLNDTLTVYFSAPIRPLTVTEDSVAVLDEDGNAVPGELRVGSNWVAFQPEVPLTPDLLDGSFRPGARYRLQLAGHPRPDSIRSRDGRWLEQVVAFDVFVAARDQSPPGLPSILRPPADELPFFVHGSEVPLPVAADAPRLQLHFSRPVLPSTVRPEAFVVRLLQEPIEELRPRSARLLTSPLDRYPGCTVELELGAVPLRVDGGRRPLADGDWLGVQVRADSGLCDYAGQVPLPGQRPLYWTVVEGDSLPLCEWPGNAHSFSADGLQPGFEVRGGRLMPRLRVEAGNGSMGVFRPQRDVVLRAGQPFDRGDGTTVVADGGRFEFESIDVPAGITVTIDARAAPVRLLACGSARIDGSVRLLAPAVPLPERRLASPPIGDLVAVAPVSLVCGGDVRVTGRIVTDTALAADRTALLLAACGRLQLRGALPVQTMLVLEDRPGETTSRFEGVRGDALFYAATFTPGVAPGSDFEAVAELPWRQLPPYVNGGRLQVIEGDSGIDYAWQATAADPIRGDRPDTAPGRKTRWRRVRDRDVLVGEAGGFVRLRLSARVRDGAPPPGVGELRIVQN